MSSASITLRQIVYGKRVQHPGGPIVPLNEFHHTGYSAGLPEELILACVIKRIGIEVPRGDWIDYPWLKEQPGWAVRMEKIAGQEWMIAVRATAFSEAGEDGPVSGRLFSQAHYLVAPLVEWRAEALEPLLAALRAEPMIEENDALEPVVIPMTPDELPLEEGWLERLEPILTALLSGQSVGWQSRTVLEGFRRDVRLCLAALPDAVSCRLPLGEALGVGGNDFALCHGVGVNTALWFSPPRPEPSRAASASLDPLPGKRYLDWMRPKFRLASTAGELHGIVQSEWPRHADPGTGHCALDWREAVRLLDQSVFEAMTVRDIALLLDDPSAPENLPIIAEPKNRRFLLELFLQHFPKARVQRYLLNTADWSDAWQAYSRTDSFLVESVLAMLGGAGQIEPGHLCYLLEQPLIPSWLRLLAERVHSALSTVADPEPWLALFSQGMLPGALAGLTDRDPWVHLIFRTARDPAALFAGLRRLGPFDPVNALCAPDQEPERAAAGLLAGEAVGSERTARFIPAIFAVLANRSPLGALLFWDELPADSASPPGELSQALARALFDEIADREARGVPTRSAVHWLTAHVLLNFGHVESWAVEAGPLLSRLLGPQLAAPILRISPPGTPAPPPADPQVERFLRCLRAMPPPRTAFWAAALAAIMENKVLKLENLVEALNAWIETAGGNALATAPPLLRWHAFFAGREPEPDRRQCPAPAIAPRREWARLFLERFNRREAQPWKLPSNPGEFDLFFYLLPFGEQQLRDSVKKFDWATVLARSLAELAEDNGSEANERLWMGLLAERKLEAVKVWRLLWRLLIAKHPLSGGQFPVITPDKHEQRLMQALSPCAAVLLAIGMVEIPSEVLDQVVFSRAEKKSPPPGRNAAPEDRQEPLPPETNPDEKGPLCIYFRTAGRMSPALPQVIRLSLNELFTLAAIARDANCKHLRQSLGSLAQGGQHAPPKNRLDRLRESVFRSPFSKPKTYAQLYQDCQ